MNKIKKYITHFQLLLNVQKLSNDTTVHGLKELYYSKKQWKGIWTIILAIAVGLTAYQVGKSVQQFVEQPTITTIQPLEEGRHLYPPFSICYLHWSSWVDWQKVVNFNISKPTLYFGLSYLGKVFSQDEFDMNTAGDDFKNMMLQNNWTYLSEFYMAISEDYPKYFSPKNNNVRTIFTVKGFYDILEMCPFCYTISGQTLNSLINDASSAIGESRVKVISFNTEKVPQVSFNNYLGQEEYAMSIRHLLQDDYSFTKNVTDYDTITIYNPQNIFPNFAADIVQVNSDVDSYVIKMKGNVYKWKSRNGARCMEGKVTNSADLTCELRCSSQVLSKLCKYVPFEASFLSQTDTLTVTCRRSITFIGQPNSADTWESLEKEIYSECQCVPNSSLSFLNDVNECLTACRIGCEVWDFETSVSYYTEQSARKNVAQRKYMRIALEYPMERSIFVIAEIDSQSWEVFVANVGGLLGIWLGASMVSFVQTIYLCCFSEDDLSEPKAVASKKQRNVERPFYYVNRKSSQVVNVNGQ